MLKLKLKLKKAITMNKHYNTKHEEQSWNVAKEQSQEVDDTEFNDIID